MLRNGRRTTPTSPWRLQLCRTPRAKERSSKTLPVSPGRPMDSSWQQVCVFTFGGFDAQSAIFCSTRIISCSYRHLSRCCLFAFFIGCYDGVARIWDNSGNLVTYLREHTGPVFSLKWSKSGTFAYIVCSCTLVVYLQRSHIRTVGFDKKICLILNCSCYCLNSPLSPHLLPPQASTFCRAVTTDAPSCGTLLRVLLWRCSASMRDLCWM